MISTLLFSFLIVSGVGALAFWLGSAYQRTRNLSLTTIPVPAGDLAELPDLTPIIEAAVKRAFLAYAPEETGPKIVVNVPPDFKGMTSLPPSELQGAAAVLWFTAFKTSVDVLNDNGSPDSSELAEAAELANEAVRTVFGQVTSRV